MKLPSRGAISFSDIVILRCPTRHRVLGCLGPSRANLLKFISHNGSPPSIWPFVYTVLIA